MSKLQEMNLIYALKKGLITFGQYLEAWRKSGEE